MNDSLLAIVSILSDISRDAAMLLSPLLMTQILERININTRKATQFNQWKNTNDVIKWFSAIDNKDEYSFICFDIVEFYPSITEELLSKALDFAAKYNTITEHERHIIIHTKQSVLYNCQIPWCKRNRNNY